MVHLICKKRVLRWIFALSSLLSAPPLCAKDHTLSPHDYRVNRNEMGPDASTYRALSTSDSSLSMSMVGWGLVSAIVIGVLVRLVHRSAGNEARPGSTNVNTPAEPITPPSPG